MERRLFATPCSMVKRAPSCTSFDIMPSQLSVQMTCHYLIQVTQCLLSLRMDSTSPSQKVLFNGFRVTCKISIIACVSCVLFRFSWILFFLECAVRLRLNEDMVVHLWCISSRFGDVWLGFRTWRADWSCARPLAMWCRSILGRSEHMSCTPIQKKGWFSGLSRDREIAESSISSLEAITSCIPVWTWV